MKNWMCAGVLLPMVGWAQLTVSPEVTDFGKVVQGERPSAVVTVANPTIPPRNPLSSAMSFARALARTWCWRSGQSRRGRA